LEKITRATLAGMIVGFIVIIAKLFGPFWGVVFGTFPAVYLSTLLIMHFRHGKQFLFHIAKALPIASPVFLIYALTVEYTYPQIGIFAGTLVAYAVCSIYPITLSYLIQKKK
jgi:hypothetical protein